MGKTLTIDTSDRMLLKNKYLLRCHNTLAETDIAIASESWNTAADRLYFTVFYAVNALFAKDGHTTKTNHGVKVLFKEHYVDNNIIDKGMLTLFAQIETLRDKADCEVFFQANKSEILNYRSKVDGFIATIKKMLK